MEMETKVNLGYDQDFDSIELPRYFQVKESVEELVKVIDMKQVKEDGIERVLTALLQLIQENNDKTVSEKYDTILDAIYNGNIFGRYFTEDNKSKAVDVLSKTTVLDKKEGYIYTINFYMPFDEEFTELYKQCGKQPRRICESYNLSEDKSNLVLARIIEIAKFYKKYKEYKDRKMAFNNTEAYAAMADAEAEPTVENIEKAKTLLSNVTDEVARETLTSQLQEIEALNKVEEPTVLEVPSSDTLNDVVEPNYVEMDESFRAPTDEDLSFGTNLETPIEPVRVEPIQEEVVLNDTPVVEMNTVSESTKENDAKEVSVGQDVMTSLRKLVSNSKQNENRVKELETNVSELNAALENKADELDMVMAREKILNETLAQKDSLLNDTQVILNDTQTRLSERESYIASLEQQLEMKNQELVNKDSEIAQANKTADAYKASLAEIQAFLTASQVEPESYNPSFKK